MLTWLRIESILFSKPRTPFNVTSKLKGLIDSASHWCWNKHSHIYLLAFQASEDLAPSYLSSFLLSFSLFLSGFQPHGLPFLWNWNFFLHILILGATTFFLLASPWSVSNHLFSDSLILLPPGSTAPPAPPGISLFPQDWIMLSCYILSLTSFFFSIELTSIKIKYGWLCYYLWIFSFLVGYKLHMSKLSMVSQGPQQCLAFCSCSINKRMISEQ